MQGKRFFAMLIDYVCALYVATPFAYAINGFQSVAKWPSLVAFAGMIVVYTLTGNLLFNGASVGKKLVHIRVMSVTGKPATPWQLLLRQVTLLLLPIELLVILLENKRFGDLLAKTMVVEEL